MEYQVWTKEEYEEGWRKVDCGDIAAAKRELEKAIIAGKDTLLTAAIPFEFNIKVDEGKLGAAPTVKSRKKETKEVEEVKPPDETPESKP